MEETVEVRFLHHYTDRTGDKPKAIVPGDRVACPVSLARSLVASKVAEYPTKKAERAAAESSVATS